MSGFRVIEHTVPCQHIREYPRATASSQEDILHLAVKQYIPLSNPEPRAGDVTIIAATANGFPKELYEPLWEDIVSRASGQGWMIRGIWMADVAQQGTSSIINESLLGNDPSWHDHARDLLFLVNLKRDEMPRPIIGMGHSMGGNNIINLALMHPRLFTTVIMMDPVIQERSAELEPTYWRGNLARLSTFRRDLWPSRDAAAAAFQKSAFYRAWDPRVLDKWIQYGLREAPTALHPHVRSPQVTLTTTPAQEVFTFLRPNYEEYGVDGNPIDRSTHADIDPTRKILAPFYRAEVPYTFDRLPAVRPSVLYIFGGKSNVSLKEMNEEKIRRTGSGVGGSGGAQANAVKGITFAEVGHMIPMEATTQTAEAVNEWITKEVGRFRLEQEAWEEWKQRPLAAKQDIDDAWRKAMGGAPAKAKM